MEWLIAVLIIFPSWFLFVILPIWQTASEDVNNPLPDGSTRGVSIAPGFPVLPVAAIVLWAICGPTGRSTLIYVHVALLVFSIVWHALGAWLHNRLRKSRSLSI